MRRSRDRLGDGGGGRARRRAPELPPQEHGGGGREHQAAGQFLAEEPNLNAGTRDSVMEHITELSTPPP